jgi:hypothetical protein
MPVNIEIKGNLAKLLATENLIIEHKKVDTASFDIERRVLTLPQWETDSNVVYDMLVAHEVGHALHTPLRDWRKEEKYKDVPKDYINVVEDARIEKLMKQRFAGLNRDFYKAYEELFSQDFFEVSDDDVNDLKLIDKINLYFKIGAYLCIDFNDEENQLITEISQAETFDQVLDLSLRLYKLSQSQKQEIDALHQVNIEVALKEMKEDEFGQPANPITFEPSDESDDDAPEVEGKGNKPEDQLDEQVDDKEEPEVETTNKAGNHGNIEVSDTQRSFDKHAEEFTNNDEYGRETTYVTIPKLNLDSVTIEFDTIRDSLKKHFTHKSSDLACEHQFSINAWNNSLDSMTHEFNKFKQSSRKEVNNLVKEFEMKKSADSYSRSATSRTGMLDMNKLHTYKFNEDIFKKVTVIPEGKNHGLVFLLDWSGSMQYVLEDTLKQLFNLVWFCRKVQIPFEVYAFTNDSWMLDSRLDASNPYPLEREMPTHHIFKENQLVVGQGFRMVNILSSEQRGRDLDEMMKLLYCQTLSMCKHVMDYDRKFCLSGTPLNEAIIATGQMVKEFIKSRGIQKCHTVILTDGDAFHMDYTRKIDETGYHSKGYIHSGGFMIRSGTRTYSGGNGHSDFTCSLIKAMKDQLPDCSFLGIRILERDYRHFYMHYARDSYLDFEEMKAQNKKEGMIHFKSKSFDKWYGISGTKLHSDDELAVDQGADKRQISTAFKKMNRGKKTNRVMVKQFIDQIA